jgi:hypothetical protein
MDFVICLFYPQLLAQTLHLLVITKQVYTSGFGMNNDHVIALSGSLSE